MTEASFSDVLPYRRCQHVYLHKDQSNNGSAHNHLYTVYLVRSCAYMLSF